MVRTKADLPNHQNRSGDYDPTTNCFRKWRTNYFMRLLHARLQIQKHPKKFKNYSTTIQGKTILVLLTP